MADAAFPQCASFSPVAWPNAFVVSLRICSVTLASEAAEDDIAAQ